jgi:methionyl-tRNA formyltransferase
LRIHRARVIPEFSGASGALSVENGTPVVGTGGGGLQLVEVQWEGKPRITGRDFVNGLRGAPIRFAS